MLRRWPHWPAGCGDQNRLVRLLPFVTSHALLSFRDRPVERNSHVCFICLLLYKDALPPVEKFRARLFPPKPTLPLKSFDVVPRLWPLEEGSSGRFPMASSCSATCTRKRNDSVLFEFWEPVAPLLLARGSIAALSAERFGGPPPVVPGKFPRNLFFLPMNHPLAVLSPASEKSTESGCGPFVLAQYGSLRPCPPRSASDEYSAHDGCPATPPPPTPNYPSQEKCLLGDADTRRAQSRFLRFACI